MVPSGEAQWRRGNMEVGDEETPTIMAKTRYKDMLHSTAGVASIP